VGKHRAVVIGAGRIGASYEWSDRDYTHAGAYQALRDRVELVGFVEPDNDRAISAKLKWHVPVYEDVPTGIMALRPDILSICVQPEQQAKVYQQIEWSGIKGVWQEKPMVVIPSEEQYMPPIQVNYMRRGDQEHQRFASMPLNGFTLIVYGKDDIHTRCHFEDLRDWWKVPLDYRPFMGPCAYILTGTGGTAFFDNGGVDGATCFKAMLGNLLDHVDSGTPLWSPPR